MANQNPLQNAAQAVRGPSRQRPARWHLSYLQKTVISRLVQEDAPLVWTLFLPLSNLTVAVRTSRNSTLLLLWERGRDMGWGVRELHSPGHKGLAGHGTQGIFFLNLEGETLLHLQSQNQKDVSWKRLEALCSLLWNKPTYTGTE